MKSGTSAWSVAATMALAVLAQAPAIAAPTMEEVNEARADCRMHRERVEELEVTYRPPPPSSAAGVSAMSMGSNELEYERAAWDRSCAYAASLMQAAGMEKKASAPRASAPAEIRMTERKVVKRKAPIRDENAPSVGGTKARRETEPSPDVIAPMSLDEVEGTDPPPQ